MGNHASQTPHIAHPTASTSDVCCEDDVIKHCLRSVPSQSDRDTELQAEAAGGLGDESLCSQATAAKRDVSRKPASVWGSCAYARCAPAWPCLMKAL